MRCKDAQILMTVERSEALGPDQTFLLGKHVAGCAACRVERAEIGRIGDLLSDSRSGLDYAPRPDTAALLSRSQQTLRKETRSWRGLALGAVGVGAAVLVVGFVGRRLSVRPVGETKLARGSYGPALPQIATIQGDSNETNSVKNNSLEPGPGKGVVAASDGSLSGHAKESPANKTNATISPKQQMEDDLRFLNPQSATSVGIARWPSDEVARYVERLEKAVKSGDDFVTVPVPQVAASSEQSSKTAAEAYQKERSIVDARLVRKLTIAKKGASFAELCLEMTRETGIQITANRKVAEDKVTVFCKDRPLRDVMRQIASLFGFTWLRSGKEGEFEYELTQTLKSELLEEALREKDRNEMLLSLDRQMDRFRPYLGLSLAQIKSLANKRLSAGIKEKAAFDEYNTLHMLERGGLFSTNMFFRLTPRELDALRNGEKLTWDLRTDQLGLPPPVMNGIQDTFNDMVTGAPKDLSKLSATLELDRSKQGEYILKGGLYNPEGGMSATLAHAISPSKDKKRIENAVVNAALSKDPALQQKISIALEPTCTLVRPPYPDTDLAYAEHTGPKVLTYDVLEALHQKTGKDIIADQFMRLHNPAEISANDARLFDALNHAGDAMQIRWTREEGWLKFRSPDYYYARPQEVPTSLFEHWAEVRKKRGVLGVDELGEIARLTDAQLDSISTAQGAVAAYGLEEWPVARQDQGRPHWRFLGKLSRQQREAAVSDRGVQFMALSAALKRDYVKLSSCAETGLYLTEADMRDANLKVLYSPLADASSADSPASHLLPRNAAVFLYSFGNPKRYSAIGPFNAIVGLTEAMLAEHLKPKSKAD